jgi:U4/U6.U5 tri-snRNP-associated protein 3
MLQDVGLGEVANDPQAVNKDRGRKSASPRRSDSPSSQQEEPEGLLSRKNKQQQQQQAAISFHVGGYQDEQEQDDDRSQEEAMEEDEEDPEVVVDDEGLADMQAMMGFGGFGSTKGQKVAGNNVGAVHKEKKTEYRQYMNRTGGFNRPLSPSR